MLEYDQFLDFKTMSRELRILKCRYQKVDLGDIVEVKLNAEYPNKIFFKTSHAEEEFSHILLERLPKSVSEFEPKQLNQEPQKISKAKHDDLMKLCSGDTAVVNTPAHQQF